MLRRQMFATSKWFQASESSPCELASERPLEKIWRLLYCGGGVGVVGAVGGLPELPPELLPPFVPFEFKLRLKPVGVPVPTGVVVLLTGWPMAPVLPPCII
jgi:hypothetical protein